MVPDRVPQKMFFSSDNCKGVTTGGRNYDADRSGFIHPDSSDVAALKAGGYVIAGGMPRLAHYWVCECGWEAAINSCPKCKREDLTKVKSQRVSSKPERPVRPLSHSNFTV